jgi:outer membrane lipoprotein-sorting protein
MRNYRTTRGLVAIGLAVGLVVAACNSSAPNPLTGGGGNNNGAGGGGGGGSALASGLASNLDQLDSYQFSWQFTAAGSTATSADTGSFGYSGTVVNKPTKAYKINYAGLMIIVIGSQGWTSYDNGATWMTTTDYSSPSSLSDLLPTADYATNFDANANDFKVAGDETKNGVDCVHYTGTQGTGAAALLGVAGTFKADLWVAKSGNYPVSGFYGWTYSINGQTGSWGYQFDYTHINDAAANTITAPTNVVSLPS